MKEKTIYPILAGEVPFVVLAVMIVGDLLANLEEWGEQSVLLRLVNDWWLDDEEEHVRGRERDSC